MDGLQARVNESVQLKLSLTISLAILAVAIAAGFFSFFSAMEEAHELQDDVLRQIAALMARQGLSPGLYADDGRLMEGDDETRVFVQRLDPGSSAAGGQPNADDRIPTDLSDGLHNADVGERSLRILIRTMPGGERWAIAQEALFRDEMARDSALRTVLPLLILVPILVLIVADRIRRQFRPIAALAGAVDERTEQDLHAVPVAGVPVEVRPFVVAINRMLGRVERSVEAQRRFVTDAAHELRSPLTALSLQAERLAAVDMPEGARERLTSLRQGIERGRSLLEQLLSFARAQATSEMPAAPVSVQGIYTAVLEDLMPLAEAKGIDIGVESTGDASVDVAQADLFLIVKNLVDNAIRYTPQGGRVDLSVESAGNHVVLQVRDTGPGVPESERTRVFDPFYRGLGTDELGSGLGLSIVKTIVDRIGATIDLSTAEDATESGLLARVHVPCHT